jgi:hypothetical protein
MTLDTQRKPYSILMSEAERHHIAQQAAPLGISVPEFIRITALNKDLEKALLKIKKQQVDNKEAAQILAALGRSHIPSNLNQIAKSIHTGSFIFSPDIEKQITDSYDFIVWIRDALIRQQGLKP